MRPDTAYHFDPFLFKALASQYELPPLTCSLFRQMMDCAWMGPNKYFLTCDLEQLAEDLACSVEDCRNAVSDLLETDNMLLIEQYCSTKQEIVWVIPWLKNQSLINNDSNGVLAPVKSTSLKDALAKRGDYSPSSVVYLNRVEVIADTFRGWLPTRRYFEKGQAYLVSEDLQAAFQEQYPLINAVSVFCNVFSWLIENPNGRPSSSKMEEFLQSWFFRANRNKQKRLADATDSESDQTVTRSTDDNTDMAVHLLDNATDPVSTETSEADRELLVGTIDEMLTAL